LLLLTVPVGFYRRGAKAAMVEVAVLTSLFLLTMWGRRWLTFFTDVQQPDSLDSRIVTALAFTTMIVGWGEVQLGLRPPFSSLFGGFEMPLRNRLAGSSDREQQSDGKRS
jgi:hypothetical protein